MEKKNNSKDDEFEKFKSDLITKITEKEKYRCEYERTGRYKDLFLGVDEEEYYRQLEIMRQYEKELQLYIQEKSRSKNIQ